MQGYLNCIYSNQKEINTAQSRSTFFADATLNSATNLPAGGSQYTTLLPTQTCFVKLLQKQQKNQCLRLHFNYFTTKHLKCRDQNKFK